MADHARFIQFSTWLVHTFPAAVRIYDVAGGMGRLNQCLTALGRECTTFDRRHKHLDVRYAPHTFTLAEPCAADLVVGLHPDAATRIIIAYAAHHNIPFALIPCCSDNSMSYKPWMQFLHDYAHGLGLQTAETTLPISGRNRVIFSDGSKHQRCAPLQPSGNPSACRA